MCFFKYVQRRTEKGTKQTRALFVAYFFAALGFFAFGFLAAGFLAAFFGFLAAGFFAAFFGFFAAGFFAAFAFCVVFARLCVEIEVAVSRQHDCFFCCVFAADKKNTQMCLYVPSPSASSAPS